MPVNRLWSIVLFEGYGAFLPMIVSILMSNKQQLMGLIETVNAQK